MITRLEVNCSTYATLSNKILTQLLADDFLEVGCLEDKYYKNAVMKRLAVETGIYIELLDFSIKQLDNNIVIAIYKAVKRMTDKQSVMNSLRSSIWHKRGNKWQIVYHQGTRCD